MTPLDGLDVRARGELGQLAELVGRSDLCSLLFPHFIRGVEEHYGMRHSGAVNEVADRIEKIHTLGLHLSPGGVAKVLRDFAGRIDDDHRRPASRLLKEPARSHPLGRGPHQVS